MKVVVTVAVTKDADNYNSITTTAQMQVAGSKGSIQQALFHFPIYTLLNEALLELEDKEKATKEILEKINNEPT